LSGFLAILSAAGAGSEVAQPGPRIAATLAGRASGTATERLTFNAKSSTTFLKELQSFLSLIPEHKTAGTQVVDPYMHLVEAFREAAEKEGVAATRSVNLVDVAYDWIDRNEWKYFVRLEVDFAAFEALFYSARGDSLYRDVAMANLIYGGQGILDFKRNVPDYIDQIRQQQAFQTAKFQPRSKKQVQRAHQLAAQRVDVQLARYRTAMAFLRSRGIDADTLRKKAGVEQRPRLKEILLHYAELLRREVERVQASNDFQLRIAILLSDVEREFPEVVIAVLKIGERNKQVVLDKRTGAFEADYATFRFLVED
jgi:hypothetical protein